MTNYERVLKQINNCMVMNKTIPSHLFKEFINAYLDYHSIKSDVKYVPNSEGINMTLKEKKFKYKIFLNLGILDERILDDEDLAYDNAFDNLIHLFYLLHELTHVEQYYRIDKKIPLFNSNFLQIQFKNSVDAADLDATYLDMNAYNNYHDYFLFEYYADIRALIGLNNLIEKYFDLEDDTLEFINFYIANAIMCSYTADNKITYPLLNSAALYETIRNVTIGEHIEEFDIRKLIKYGEFSSISDIDKIKIGLPISKNLHNKILKFSTLSSDGEPKVKTRNFFKEIS